MRDFGVCSLPSGTRASAGAQLRQANEMLGTMGGGTAGNLRSAQKKMSKLSSSVRNKVGGGERATADSQKINTDYLPPEIPSELKPAPEQRPVLELE